MPYNRLGYLIIRRDHNKLQTSSYLYEKNEHRSKIPLNIGFEKHTLTK